MTRTPTLPAQDRAWPLAFARPSSVSAPNRSVRPWSRAKPASVQPMAPLRSAATRLGMPALTRLWAPMDVGAAALHPAEAARLGGGFVDLSPSPVYRKGHAPGAWFVSGARLRDDLKAVPGAGPLVLFSSDARLPPTIWTTCATRRLDPSMWSPAGLAAWVETGFPVETDSVLWASEPDDVYKRPYEGTDNARAAMQAYIDWELQLVAQLANDGVSNFHVIR
jgi:hypothetical protein